MKLIIEKETNITAKVECMYKNRLKTALPYDESLFQFYQSANNLMSSVNTGNHLRMEDLYSVHLSNDSVEVWHLNINGKKDRLVMRVVEKPINDTKP